MSSLTFLRVTRMLLCGLFFTVAPGFASSYTFDFSGEGSYVRYVKGNDYNVVPGTFSGEVRFSSDVDPSARTLYYLDVSAFSMTLSFLPDTGTGEFGWTAGLADLGPFSFSEGGSPTAPYLEVNAGLLPDQSNPFQFTAALSLFSDGLGVYSRYSDIPFASAVITYTATTASPEPCTFALIGSTALLLLGARRAALQGLSQGHRFNNARKSLATVIHSLASV